MIVVLVVIVIHSSLPKIVDTLDGKKATNDIKVCQEVYENSIKELNSSLRYSSIINSFFLFSNLVHKAPITERWTGVVGTLGLFTPGDFSKESVSTLIKSWSTPIPTVDQIDVFIKSVKRSKALSEEIIQFSRLKNSMAPN